VAQNPLYKWVCKLSFLTSALSTSAVLVLFEGLYRGIPWVLSCNNCSNYETRCRPRFDHCSRWILIISRRVSLSVTLEFGILISLHVTAALGHRLEQTVLAYRLHRNLSNNPYLSLFGPSLLALFPWCCRPSWCCFHLIPPFISAPTAIILVHSWEEVLLRTGIHG